MQKFQSGCQLPTRNQILSDYKTKHFDGDFWLLCFHCKSNASRKKKSYYTKEIAKGDSRNDISGKYEKDDYRILADLKFDPGLLVATETPESYRLVYHDPASKTDYAKLYCKTKGRAEMGTSLMLGIRRFDKAFGIEEDASELLKKTEETLGNLSQIVSPGETLQFDLDGVGTVRLTRDEKETDITNLEIGESEAASLVWFEHHVSEAFQEQNQDILLMSDIVSVSIVDLEGSKTPDREPKELSHSITIPFEMEIPDDNETLASARRRCVFWDFDASAWSSKGCRILSSNSSATNCQCDHLTNFAIILDLTYSFYEEVSLSLRWITVVCCSVSIVSLIGCIVFFLSHRGSELTDRIKINAHFCGNLLLVQVRKRNEVFKMGLATFTLQVLMVFGINQGNSGSSHHLCQAVAVMLQLFLLASFTWSLLAAHQVGQKIIVASIPPSFSEKKLVIYFSKNRKDFFTLLWLCRHCFTTLRFVLGRPR